jgi:hypothetical protein
MIKGSICQKTRGKLGESNLSKYPEIERERGERAGRTVARAVRCSSPWVGPLHDPAVRRSGGAALPLRPWGR